MAVCLPLTAFVLEDALSLSQAEIDLYICLPVNTAYVLSSSGMGVRGRAELRELEKNGFPRLWLKLLELARPEASVFVLVCVHRSRS